MATVALIEEDPPSSPPMPSMFAAPDPHIIVSNSPTLPSSDHYQSLKPIISFGLIADIQYSNSDDRYNYTKTHLRRYRNALKLVDEACDYWLKQKFPISFVLQLGDIIDGTSATNQSSQIDLNTILQSFSNLPSSCPIYHIWGNHELYNFTRAELLTGPLCSFETKNTMPGHYGTFIVCPGLRIIALDTYEFSALGVDEKSETYLQAMELLGKYNHNESFNSPTGLRGHQRRFVQFNGGLTSKQLDWLREQLTEASRHNEKVIVIGESFF
jgi:manganese-dependent ADP-ribose/CDP-alcohol diphosphatase